MNTKHTPGPWKTRKGFDSDTIEVFAPNPKIGRPFQPTELAVVQADSREGKANASLIAAAPELLEAVQSLLPIAVHYLNADHDADNNNPPAGNFDEIMNAMCAIAKATGKEPA